MALTYVISYPKSGATWFRLLMYALFHQKLDNSNEVQLFYPELPNQEDLVLRNLEEGGDFFIKNHVAFSEDLKFLEQATRIIYISRNPFNCMLSKLDHYKYEGVNWVSKDDGFVKFCTDFMDNASKPPSQTSDKLHGGWNYHIQSWFNAQLEIPVINIRYEDLAEDTVTALQKLSDEVGWNFSHEAIEKAVELASFNRIMSMEMHELTNKVPGMFYSEKRRKAFMEDNSMRFVKLGKKRDAIRILPVEMILRGKIVFYEGMQIAGYR